MGRRVFVLFGPLARGQTCMYQPTKRRRCGLRVARVAEPQVPGDRDSGSPPGSPGGQAGSPCGGASTLSFSNSTGGTTGFAPYENTRQEERDASSVDDEALFVDDFFGDDWSLTDFL